MPAIARYDYAAYISNQKRGDYPMIAEMIRKGDISCLCQEARDLLADYLEGKKLPQWGQSKDDFELAELIYDEIESLVMFGSTRDKVSKYMYENGTQENYKNILDDLRPNGMSKTKAFEKLSERIDIVGIIGKNSIKSKYYKWSKHLKMKG